MPGGAASLHTEVAVPEAGVAVNVILILLNTSVLPGERQVSAEQDRLKAVTAFCFCDSGTLDPSHAIYAWGGGIKLVFITQAVF